MDTNLDTVFNDDKYYTELDIKNILYQILLGLKGLHSADIIHTNLRPSNIFMKQDNTIKISDFGLAKDIHDHNVINTGSFYQAPEVHLKNINIDTIYAIDIFSVGAIFGKLLQMLKKCTIDYMFRNPLFEIDFRVFDALCNEVKANKLDNRMKYYFDTLFDIIGKPTFIEISKLIKDDNARQYVNSLGYPRSNTMEHRNKVKLYTLYVLLLYLFNQYKMYIISVIWTF